MITDVKSLDEMQEAFEKLDANPAAMKTLIARGNRT